MFFEALSNNILHVINDQQSLIGLGLPFCLSLLFLSFDKNKIHNHLNIIILFVVTVLINSLTVHLENDSGLVSLSFTSFAIFTLAAYAWYNATALSVYKVFYFTFFSSLLTDILAAPNNYHRFLDGIGGAGWGDGLLLIPLIYTLTFILLDMLRRLQMKPALLTY
ncbi:hypothetical protein [Paraferrimonas sp. SM1919]|uniref:hypothetical protein n=1 Tax=Paraferrimonas sp. SM1919 TaxID=2662263 RepID=UPI0013D765F5|nr:hypothetical protein [Paraferrimonas sp. SM1919]